MTPLPRYVCSLVLLCSNGRIRYIHKKYGGDVTVDMIFPEEITLKRLTRSRASYGLTVWCLVAAATHPERLNN